MKNKYVPFLKLKMNEIGALKELHVSIKNKLVPFFDLVKNVNDDPEKLSATVVKAAKSVIKHLRDYGAIYLDNYDIDDSLLINGKDNYYFVIEEFKEVNFIPVVGVDRTDAHNRAVFEGRKNGLIKSSVVAIRLQHDDFSTFELTEDELESLFNEGEELFESWDLILDNRVCLNVNVAQRAKQLSDFIRKIDGRFPLRKVIVTGSSIPSSISEILKVENDITHKRTELAIFDIVEQSAPVENLVLGDYTVVSPMYSDLDIRKEAMRNVTTPKITYSYENLHFIMRGGSLKRHVRGALQYNDIAEVLTTKVFFRPPTYSFGDQFLSDKSKSLGAQVTPSSILKPTINAHITYMSRDFPI